MNEATAMLFDRLNDETCVFSSLDLMRQTPTFGVLKAKGKEILPDIHEALIDDHAATMALIALAEEITGDHPEIADEDRGDNEKLIQAWVDYLDAFAHP